MDTKQTAPVNIARVIPVQPGIDQVWTIPVFVVPTVSILVVRR